MAMLKVGAMGFGGGSALIPLVGEELVDRRRVITQKAFIQHTIISSVTPGAQPVKLGALAGMQISGPWLALVMALAVSFPGTVGTLALVAGIDAGGAAVVRYVGYASVGITVFILALLLHYTIRVIQQAHSRRLAVAILVFSAVATGAGELVELIGRLFGQSWHVSLPKLSTVQLIGAALVVIVGLALVRGSKNEDHRQTEVGPKLSLWTPLIVRTSLVLLAAAVIVTFLAVLVVGFESLRFLGLVVVSALTTFGGGAAYVGVADGIFVGGEWVTSADFYGQLVPISNAMPGPILIKLAAAIGFGTAASQGPLAAWTLGVAAAVVGLAACSVVAVIVMAVFERAPNSPIVR
ncbi:MAG TPA: chromate transporter, partial [Tessaracoccus flavescens]|nr:chromate transporter [Tessaracoccus flavescens]